MPEKNDPKTDPSQPAIYQIRIKGQMNPQWRVWFECMAIALDEDGVTLITGPVADQAALHGLLKKVRDLGLPLISVCPVELGTSQADAPEDRS
jgi:hypothetical protein